eukprot:SAG31_NODE_23115_length_511_cov_0.694175_1_plen_50_part_01
MWQRRRHRACASDQSIATRPRLGRLQLNILKVHGARIALAAGDVAWCLHS